MSERATSKEFQGYALKGAAILTGMLALAGCGSGSGQAEASPSVAFSSQVPEATIVTAPLTFDDLGGGSSIIRVFPGVGPTAEDRRANGTYNDGDTAEALCRIAGRNVHSDSSVGERDRSSSQWVMLQTPDNTKQYASAVYVESPQVLLKQLQECPPA